MATSVHPVIRLLGVQTYDYITVYLGISPRPLTYYFIIANILSKITFNKYELEEVFFHFQKGLIFISFLFKAAYRL